MLEPAARALPFQLFVLVCDRDKAVGPRAALEFRKILAGGARGASAAFAEMLAHSRESYPALWRDYAGAKAPIDLRGFVETLISLRGSMTAEEYEGLERDLARLARSLFRASYLLRPRPAQRRAYDDVVRALRTREWPRPDERGIEAGRGPRPAPPRAAPARGEPSAGGRIRLVCAKITDEARGVKTFAFERRDEAPLRFQPGQFLTIEPPIGDATVTRSYTIASSPTPPAVLEITVKRILGGLVSNWLHDHLRVGDALDARGPFGRFSCAHVPREKYLFLAAGIGITPLMSMLRYLHAVAAPADLVFLHSARTEQDLVFREELARIDRSPHFRIAFTLTGPSTDGGWAGLRGRLDNAMLLRIAPDLGERAVLACGPGGFLDKVRQLLAGNGFPLATQYVEESFRPRRSPALGGPARTGRAATAHAVRFVRSGKTAAIAADETILDAAERCGLGVPSACRQGRCGTCRVVLTSGRIRMEGQEALSPEDEARGEILACIAQPASAAVEVDL